MKRVFVDANIVVDLLCERYPWFPSVMRIFNMADRGQIELYCSSPEIPVYELDEFMDILDNDK